MTQRRSQAGGISQPRALPLGQLSTEGDAETFNLERMLGKPAAISGEHIIGIGVGVEEEGNIYPSPMLRPV